MLSTPRRSAGCRRKQASVEHFSDDIRIEGVRGRIPSAPHLPTSSPVGVPCLNQRMAGRDCSRLIRGVAAGRHCLRIGIGSWRRPATSAISAAISPARALAAACVSADEEANRATPTGLTGCV